MRAGKRKRRELERARKRKVALLWCAAAACAVAILAAWQVWSRTRWQRVEWSAAPVLTAELASHSRIPSENALTCAECHRAEFDEWNGSQHAIANRLVGDTDKEAFTKHRKIEDGKFTTIPGISGGRFSLTTVDDTRRAVTFFPEAVIGVEPLRQYLIPFPGGRLQVHNIAYDPGKKEWFNAQMDVHGDTHYLPQDWAFWQNPGMNWNSQCAFCHMTDLQKNYDIPKDQYRTTWSAMGISCAQCHGPMKDHLAQPNTPGLAKKLPASLAMENCASCHARREELTGNFHAGEKFTDHYRLMLPDYAEIYYPDGQVHDEDFEYGAFLLSRMGHKGVTCLDCHNPHSGGLVAPVENNALCLTCHAPPGQRGAIPVDAAAHSHHPAGSSGARCISCHMPESQFMVRDKRRGHSFTIPDPVLTRELGTPNTCNQCHADKNADWAAGWTEKWYGEKMERRTRARARVIARGRQGAPDADRDLVAMLRSEEIPAWRAALTGLLEQWAASPPVRQALGDALKDESPLVRSAAVRALAADSSNTSLLSPLLQDPSRLVRLDAAWAMTISGRPDLAKSAELEQYLAFGSDQPAGALRQAQLALVEHRKEDAAAWAHKAARWDDSSPVTNHAAGMLLNAAGKPEEALPIFERAVAVAPDDPQTRFALALLYGELGRTDKVIESLQKVVKLAPQMGRAWYNLGLALAQQGRLPDALEALAEAGKQMPESPEPPYARATLYLRMGDRAAARKAAQEALAIDPGFRPAMQFR